MKSSVLIFFAAISLFSAQEGQTDVRIRDLEVFLSGLETRVNQHKKGVDDSVAMQKEAIIELDEDRIAKLEAWLVKTKTSNTNEVTPSSP